MTVRTRMNVAANEVSRLNIEFSRVEHLAVADSCDSCGLCNHLLGGEDRVVRLPSVPAPSRASTPSSSSPRDHGRHRPAVPSAPAAASVTAVRARAAAAGASRHHPRGHAHHEGARRHVACDDRPRRHERVLADLDARQQHGPGADAAGPPQRRPA